MLEALNNSCLYVTDFLLGWSLNLPRDVVILIVAVLTGIILTLVRLFTTDQNWLKRCQADKKRLKALIREAKARGDKEAVARHRMTIQMIGMKSFKCEGLPLLASIVPIAMIAVWAFTRLAYLAPQPGQAITLTVDFPASAEGTWVYLAPQEGLKCDGNTWMRRVRSEDVQFETYGRRICAVWGENPVDSNDRTTVKRARWKVTAEGSDRPYPLLFRIGGETLDHELIVDGKKYFSPIGVWGENNAYSLRMDVPEYKFLQFLPSIDLYWNQGLLLPMDAWILGYLIIVIPLALILKPILRIA